MGVAMAEPRSTTGRTPRKRQAVIEAARYTAKDHTDPAPFYSHLGVSHLSNVNT